MKSEINFGIFGQIKDGVKKDHQSRLLAIYIGSGLLISFLALVSLAPQIGERLGTLSVKKSHQESLAASPLPVLLFKAIPPEIQSGETSILSWSAANVSICHASGGWNAQKPTSGREIVKPTQTTVYVLTCQGKLPQESVTEESTVTISDTPGK